MSRIPAGQAIAFTNIVLLSLLEVPCLSVSPLASCGNLSDLLLFPLPSDLFPLGRQRQHTRMFKGARSPVKGVRKHYCDCYYYYYYCYYYYYDYYYYYNNNYYY